MNASDVIAALRVHYGDSWKLIEQVAEGTGWHATRHLDAIAMGLWPSRGLELHGIEVKVSRADVKREMQLPEKAEAVAACCDRFYLAAPVGIVDPAMLAAIAPSWGLLEVEDQKDRRVIKIARQAEKLTPRPLDRIFLAAILRRIPMPSEALRAEITEAETARLGADFESRVQAAADRLTRDSADLIERVRVFEDATGIRLQERTAWGWLTTKGVADAVVWVARQRAMRWDGVGARMTSAANAVRNQVRQLAEVADSLEAAAQIMGEIGASHDG